MAPERLRVAGDKLLLPNNAPALLRGFNLEFMLDSVNSAPRAMTDNMMMQRFPRANLVRLVMVHWHDRPTELWGNRNRSNDCSETETPGQTVSHRCLEMFDSVLNWTAAHGLWAIVTARASIAAGEAVAGHEYGTVFTNMTLQRSFIDMWRTLAERFRTVDRIAGYEPLSEPRVEPDASGVADDAVRNFYMRACIAIATVDPRTPCMVGATRFYNKHRLDTILLRPLSNVIYLFNAFVENTMNWTSGSPAIPYGGLSACCSLHSRFDSSACCQQACCDRAVRFDHSFLNSELQKALAFSRSHRVPVLCDQWGAPRGAGPSRLTFARDLIGLFAIFNLSWAFWEWRQRSYSPFAVLHFDHGWKKPWVDEEMLEVLTVPLGGV